MKICLVLLASIVVELVFAEGAWAWGPAVHMVLACRILEDLAHLMPDVARIIQSFSLEYVYGSLAADFFIGKGQKKKPGHSHNWETGFRLLEEAREDRDRAYAFGFLSHLAADIVAHNYFIPNLIQRASRWKRMGHLYWEARADFIMGPSYTKMARDILCMDHLGCDQMLTSAVGKRYSGIKTRRRIFTQSVKLTDYLHSSQTLYFADRGFRYRISPDYLAYMIQLSYRLVRDLMKRPYSSTCLAFDPIGSQNLSLAGQKGRAFRWSRRDPSAVNFKIDEELLEI